MHALALAPNGGLYVGTSPDGKIYKVDRNGTATTFFDPEDKYIWALAVDAKGNLFAGTGDKGVIYKITPDGKGTPFYKTKATHATALAFDKAGNLLVGTGSPGKVLRIDADGKAFVLLDSPFQEIRALRFDDKGALYVAALSGRAGIGGGGAAAPTDDRADRPAGTEAARAGRRRCPPRSPRCRSSTSAAAADRAASAREDRRSPKGAVYRIAPDGVWDQLWESRDDSPYDLDVRSERRADRRHRQQGQDLPPRGRPAAADAARARQRAAGDRVLQGRARPAVLRDREPGQAVPASSERAPRGTYESEARDAQMVVDVGRDQLARRRRRRAAASSCSRDPATPKRPTTPGAPGRRPTRTPKARRSPAPRRATCSGAPSLTGKGDGPVLTSVTAAYLQRNLRPQVRSITVHPPGIVFQKPFTTGDPELAGFDDQTTPERKLAAAASAQPGSVVVARPPHVSEGAADARLEGRRRERRRPGLRRAVPARRRDGVEDAAQGDQPTRSSCGTRRRCRTAPTSSRSSRRTRRRIPPGTALTGELDSSRSRSTTRRRRSSSATSRVDRGRTIITFDVKDDHSPIQRVEFSQDGQRWRGVFPVDGIADSRDEHYELAVDGELGERGLTLRASDAMNNVATTHVDRRRADDRRADSRTRPQTAATCVARRQRPRLQRGLADRTSGSTPRTARTRAVDVGALLRRQRHVERRRAWWRARSCARPASSMLSRVPAARLRRDSSRERDTTSSSPSISLHLARRRVTAALRSTGEVRQAAVRASRTASSVNTASCSAVSLAR